MKYIIATIATIFLFSCAKKPQEVIHPEPPKTVKTSEMDSERLKLESQPTDLSFDTTAAKTVEPDAKGLVATSPGKETSATESSVSPQSSPGISQRQTAISETASSPKGKTKSGTVATKTPAAEGPSSTVASTASSGKRSTPKVATKPSPKATDQKKSAGATSGQPEETLLADQFVDQRQTSFPITPEVLFPDSSFEGYMIQPGDFLIKIAKKEYGDWRKWRDIYRWNRKEIGDNPNLIYPYRFLDLLKPIDQLKTCELKFYPRLVNTGESLWTIAREVYGDELAWIVLFWDNESLMKANNGVLYPGMELKVREHIDPCNPAS